MPIDAPFNTSAGMNSALWHTLKIGAGGYISGLDIAQDGTKVIRTNTYGGDIWNGTMWQQLITSASLPADLSSMHKPALRSTKSGLLLPIAADFT